MTEIKTIIGDSSLVLDQAILLYKASKSLAYASVHPVCKCPTGMEIGVGRPLFLDELDRITHALRPRPRSSGYIPHNVLAIGDDNVTWYTPSSVRLAYFQLESEYEVPPFTAQVPYPGLIFCANKGLRIFAFKGDKRPTPDTQLFACPAMNVAADATLCLGNMVPPSQSIIETIPEWERLFFDGVNTHPGANQDHLIRYRKGIVQLWLDLVKRNAKTFPERYLHPFGVPAKTGAKKPTHFRAVCLADLIGSSS